MKTLTEPTWEARIYVGCRQGYDGPQFGKDEVLAAIAAYQEKAPEHLRGCVRVTETAYVFGNYVEGGWEIGIIQYPRFRNYPIHLSTFAKALAQHLLVELKQNRVSVVEPEETTTFDADGAQEAPRRN